MSPLFYTIDMVPEKYQHIFELNPMCHVLDVYRDILYYGRVPHVMKLCTALGFGILVLVIGCTVFHFAKKHFAEEL